MITSISTENTREKKENVTNITKEKIKIEND